MSNCRICGRWGIVGARYRDVGMAQIDEKGPICEFCIDKLIQKTKLECQNKITELEMIKLKMEEEEC